MKKLLSLMLVCIFAFSALSVAAYGEDTTNNYSKSYTVSVHPDQAGMIAIEGVNGNCYVREGDDFKFTVITLSDYAFDQTTCIKAWPISHSVDVLQGNDEEHYGKILYPDANGVYTIEAVDCDLYIHVYNLSSESISSVKDFVLGIFQFFLNFINWFFGLN